MVYFFYFFAFLLLVFAINVVLAVSAMRSVLSLAGVVIAVSSLLILIGAEFYAFLLAIVYVGAVLVLFLFVIMLIEDARAKKSAWVVLCCLALVALVAHKVVLIFCKVDARLANVKHVSIVDIGNAMYLEYALTFQLAGVLLLLAMCGAFLLAFERRGARSERPVKGKRVAVLIDQPIGKGIG